MKVALGTGEITNEGQFQAFLSLADFSLFYCSVQQMGQELDDFAQKVKEQRRNVALKFPPEALKLALTTIFPIGKTFMEAFKVAEVAEVEGNEGLRLRFLP